MRRLITALAVSVAALVTAGVPAASAADNTDTISGTVMTVIRENHKAPESPSGTVSPPTTTERVIHGPTGTYRLAPGQLATVPDGTKLSAKAEMTSAGARLTSQPTLAAEGTSPGTVAPAVRNVYVAFVYPPTMHVMDEWTESEVREAVGYASSYWQSQTANQVGFQVAKVLAPYTSAYSCGDAWSMWDEALAKMPEAEGVGNHLLLITPPNSQNYGCSYGLGTVGGLNYPSNYVVMAEPGRSGLAHELGHNLGLRHANGLRCNGAQDGLRVNQDFTGCTKTSYDDLLDVMGFSGNTFGEGNLNAAHVAAMGLLPGAVQDVNLLSGNATYRIAPLSAASTVLRGLRITDSTGERYYLNYRTLSGRDSVAARNYYRPSLGVEVLRDDPAYGPSVGSYLLDPTPTSLSYTDYNRAVPVGGVFRAASGTLAVKVVSQDADGATIAVATGNQPAFAPAAPTNVVALAGDRQATVSWTAPNNDGGSVITGYTVTANPGGQQATVTGTTATFADLTNGTPYTFTVTARNDVGDSPASLASNAVTPNPPPTTPAAPTNAAAVAGNGMATASWTAPADNGGSPITGYTVKAEPGGRTATTSGATSATVTGLTNGMTYTFTVTATNVAGTSLPSEPSNSVTPIGTPNAPAGVTATGGNGMATINWTAPTSDGGSAITGYTVTSTPGSKTAQVTGTGTTATVTGLTNGTAYTFTVTATNAVGTSPASAASAPVTPKAPAAPPGAPTGARATAGDTKATVTWTAPTSNGASAITGYTVTSTPGSRTAQVTGTGTTATVTGLTNGTAYTFTVTATNAVGTSPVSAASNSVTPKAPATAPGAPTGAKATAGDTKATVSWTAPTSNGGSAITKYTVTSSPGGKTATTTGATSTTVTGLTNGTSYTFTVTATNAVGTGAASARSNAVTPTAPVIPGVVERWAGKDRFASSAAFSAKSYPAGVNVAYIANGLNFPDALSGAPIAGKTGGPVLLTSTTSLPSSIATELKRLKPKKIVVLGGTGAVSNTVKTSLAKYATSGVVDRWAGKDRFASSATFSAKSYPAGVNVAYIANGLNFPDALSGAPIAGKTGGPVLLTSTTSLPSSIATELKRLKPKKIVVLGGTGAVSTTVERQLKSYLG